MCLFHLLLQYWAGASLLFYNWKSRPQIYHLGASADSRVAPEHVEVCIREPTTVEPRKAYETVFTAFESKRLICHILPGIYLKFLHDTT